MARSRPQLTDEQRHFCDAYHRTGDPVDAYDQAYGTRLDAADHATRLLNLEEITDYLEGLRLSERVEEVPEPIQKALTGREDDLNETELPRVIQHLQAIVFAKPTDMFGPMDDRRSISEWPADLITAIEQISFNAAGLPTVKFASKTTAANALANIQAKLDEKQGDPLVEAFAALPRDVKKKITVMIRQLLKDLDEPTDANR